VQAQRICQGDALIIEREMNAVLALLSADEELVFDVIDD
jgi:hypothetical protein